MYSYTKTILSLKVFVIYIICNITGGTLCYVLKIEGGFLNPRKPPPYAPAIRWDNNYFQDT